MVTIGNTYTFNMNCWDTHQYPDASPCVLSELLSYHGQQITILRELVNGEEYDREDGDPMFKGQFTDGKLADVWLYELV